MPYLPAKSTPSLCFGEICSGTFLRDVYVRADCTQLRRTQLSLRESRDLGANYNLEAYAPVPPATAQELRYSLAHGDHWEAYVVLSDDCVGERCFKEKHGRIVFAPTRARRALDEEHPDPEDIEEISSFEQCPLIGDPTPAMDSVALLANAFAVDWRDIEKAMQPGAGFTRIRYLDPVDLARLHERWAAQSCRVGPVVAQDNIGKLEWLLQQRGVGNIVLDAISDSLTAVGDAAWDLECVKLEAFSDIKEAEVTTKIQQPLQGSLDELRVTLRRLEQATLQAQIALGDNSLSTFP
jgi:hypothetical protein